MAASTIMTIPIITLFLIMQRFLEEGLTAGGVKG
jgi:multiple sugar transport system permease protein